MQFTLFSLLLAISFIISSVASVFTKPQRTSDESKFLFPLLLSISVWSFFGFLSSISLNPVINEWFVKGITLGAAGAPVFYTLFSLQYTNNLPKLKKGHYFLIFLIPGITIISAFTNPLHHLSWGSTELIHTWFSGTTVAYDFEIIPWIYIGYSYILLLFSLITLLRSSYYFPARFASQVEIIISALVVPLSGNIPFLFLPDIIKGVDITPIGFSIAGLLLLSGIKRHGLLKIKPLGRDYLFESMKDGVLFLDVNNQIIDFNKAATQILKINFSRNMIQNSKKIIKLYPALYELCLNSTEVMSYFQLSEYDPAYYHIQIHKLKDYRNNEIGKVLLLHDITDVKKNRDIIDQQNLELSQLNSQKDKMISIISHDLRGPFASILSLAELMREEYDSFTVKDQKSFLMQVINRVKIAYDLLENLLQWSRTISSQFVCDIKPIRVLAIIKETVEMYAGLAEDKNIFLRLDHTDLTQPEILANENLLRTILRNLITNAIKFTGEGGKVVVKVDYGPESCLISVTDNGVGISPKVLPHLFISDSLASSKGTNGEAGSGLGLLLCKEFVDKMGGKIQVESAASRGTRVSFTLAYADKLSFKTNVPERF